MSGVRVRLGNREIIIIGTAHISETSVLEVEDVIREESPDNVCIEIDASRYRSITQQSSWSRLDISQVLKQGQGFLLLANLVLASFQKRLGLDMGIKPGEEMVRAIEVSRELGIPFTLCDREIQITLKRAWHKTNFWGRNKMLALMAGSILFRIKLTPEEIEKLKEKSELENMLEELSTYLPAVKTVLIDERDRYLATKIFRAPGEKIVAVVGAGHVKGIVAMLEALEKGTQADDLTELDRIPMSKRIMKFLPWIPPLIILGLLFAGFAIGGVMRGFRLFLTWWIINGTLAAAGSLLALAHPLTILVSFMAAPLTSLNPLVAVGMATGILEYKLKKPRVLDFEGLGTDIASLKGFYFNRVTHILIVYLFSSIGSAIGTFIGLPVIAALFPF